MKKYYLLAIAISCIGFSACNPEVLEIGGNPCESVECSAHEYCFKGVCLPLEEGSEAISDACKSCTEEQICKNDQCVEINDDQCPPDCEDCVNGECVVSDPCEKVTCNSNEACVNGVCEKVVTDPCMLISCGNGYHCENGLCISETIGNECERDPDCNDGEICVSQKCTDPCNNVECGEGEGCTYGKCVSLCDDGTTDCVDLCTDVTCGEDQKCNHGQCIDKCADITCGNGYKCLLGDCVQLCFDVKCPEKQECQSSTGECIDVVDLCENVVCPKGQECDLGVCVGEIIVDDPCEKVTCSDSTKTCVNKDGEGVCVYNGDPATNDADKDGISDYNEGYNADNESASRDSDGDTIPDYKDLDSDGDTIPDAVEAGVDSLSQAPLDTDGDTVPDYLDTDSDGNGISDEAEAGMDKNGNFRDTDGNGIPDYLDADNDGDGILDILEITGLPNGNVTGGDCNGDGKPDPAGTPNKPWDCDGNGIPDYMDPDSDGDTIPDAYEGGAMDSDKDGFYNRYDKDSDGDTIPDKTEGRVDKDGMPADTDGDGIFDFLDLDSDDDGLSDSIENTLCTSELKPDTDGDGDTDVIEWAAGTDPCDKNSNSTTVGNFVFTMPYKGSSFPKKRTLSFETSVQILDIYFSFDNTGSMSVEKSTMIKELPTILNTLQCKDWGKACEENADCNGVGGSVSVICSEAGRCITNPGYGDGCFADMYTGFGKWSELDTFSNQISPQGDVTKTTQALNNMSLNGYGLEAPYQAPACASEGSKYCTTTSASKLNCSTQSGRVGCVGFRKEAIKIYVQVTDANDQCCVTSTYTNYYCTKAPYTTCVNYRGGTIAGNSLKANNIRFIELYGTSDTVNYLSGYSTTAVGVAEAIGKAAGSVDKNGKPFVYSAVDAAVASKTIQGVREIARGMKMKITADALDIDAGAKNLVKALVVNASGEKVQNRICTKGITGTGSPFQSVAALDPGTSLCYDVIPVDSNTIFPSTDKPQVKRARIRVLGDGSVLNSGIAYFLIPAEYDNSAN